MRDLNLGESHVLKRLDEKVTAGKTASVGTQFGDIVVHPTNHYGYCAEIVDPNQVKRIAFGPVPSIAFFRLAGTIKELFG